MMRVIVVGAGIIGASIAYHLSRSGAQVVIVDGAQARATAQSFGWINASFYANQDHHQLRVAGIEAYWRLSHAVPDLPLSFQGALWWEEQGKGLAAMQDALRALEYPVEYFTKRDVARKEPDLAVLPDAALFLPTEGACDADQVAVGLVKSACGLGAQVIKGAHVHKILCAGSRIRGVTTTFGDIDADHVVIAAGTGAQPLLEDIGVALPMLSRPGALVVTRPVPHKISSVLVTPEGEVRQLEDGRLISPAAARHQSDDSAVISESIESITQRTCARLARLIGVDQVALDSVGIANRPVPADGLPVIDEVQTGLHVAVMHSGVTLAAISGELVAALVTNRASNAQKAMLAPYSIDRFNAG